MIKTFKSTGHTTHPPEHRRLEKAREEIAADERAERERQEEHPGVGNNSQGHPEEPE